MTSLASKAVFGSLAVIVVLVGLLAYRPGPPRTPGTAATGAPAAAPSLLVYCAAGLKPPVEAVARDYERQYRVPVQIQYGGSGTLLANLRVARRGDLFIAAEDSYVTLARSNQLLAEVLPLARQTPVLVVPRANPKRIRSLADLARPDVALALANPEAAAIGLVVRERLRQLGQWDAIAARAKVFKPTVGEIANDVKLGAADAGLVWDATAAQYPDLLTIPCPEFAGTTSDVSACVLASTENPRAALHFARFLAARDRGQQHFRDAGFQSVPADAWAEVPEITLFSGGVNRPAIDQTIRAFEEREGVRVNRVYNGCGILVGQMKTGQRPDAYFACDVSFMREVQPMFTRSDDVARTPMVILTRKGNPRNLKSLSDLAQANLRLGVANPEQSALGALTHRLLVHENLLDRVWANVVVQTPTADLLVNQMRAGALDVAIVYQANTSQVREHLDVVPLTQPAAMAIQPFAVGTNTAHPQLLRRLHETLRSAASRRRFEESGFEWLDPVTR